MSSNDIMFKTRSMTVLIKKGGSHVRFIYNEPGDYDLYCAQVSVVEDYGSFCWISQDKIIKHIGEYPFNLLTENGKETNITSRLKVEKEVRIGNVIVTKNNMRLVKKTQTIEINWEKKAKMAVYWHRTEWVQPHIRAHTSDGSFYHYDAEMKLHRDNDLPAIIYSNGVCEWYFHGVRHRVGNPARSSPNGTEEWYFHGVLHREDGPAIVMPPSDDDEGYHMTCIWYMRGTIHRADGPAVTRSNGQVEYYLHDVKMEREQWMEKRSILV